MTYRTGAHVTVITPWSRQAVTGRILGRKHNIFGKVRYLVEWEAMDEFGSRIYTKARWLPGRKVWSR